MKAVAPIGLAVSLLAGTLAVGACDSGDRSAGADADSAAFFFAAPAPRLGVGGASGV